ncbi:MAG TPA: plasmid stabilization protein [Xanthobacteraceae bacterium]
MASITIRNVDETLKQRLKARAAEHGQSVEAEARDILREALAKRPSVSAPENLYEAIRAVVEPLGGIEIATNRRERVREPPGFE